MDHNLRLESALQLSAAILRLREPEAKRAPDDAAPPEVAPAADAPLGLDADEE